MRFILKGPDIPDDLLIERDAGRVIFFCGAGVSQADAGLPGFKKMTDAVISSLKPHHDSDIHVLQRIAPKLEGNLKNSFIPYERIYEHLEDEFNKETIDSEVAQTLKPPKRKVSLRAHKILLRLARNADNSIRLATTNHDRLFEQAAKSLKAKLHVWHPPHLPDPVQDPDWVGLIYLHGRVKEDYTEAEPEGLILSTTDYGKAYLHGGWALQFFKGLLAHNTIVFVGYSANDPPVHSLLRAVNATKKAIRLYAFQSADDQHAADIWRGKGVTPILYAEHEHLWETLKFWAKRADNPEKWRQSVVRKAKKRPQKLSAIEREHIAHVISTEKGMKEFTDLTPPAEWLCVFDPEIRRQPPSLQGEISFFGEKTERREVHPFDLYGLASDPPPSEKSNEEGWSAFKLTEEDKVALLNDQAFPKFFGGGAAQPADLPPRLRYLAIWISRVMHQPAALWWAVRRQPLHPSLLRLLCLNYPDMKKTSNSIRYGWKVLLENTTQPYSDLGSYNRSKFIAAGPWTASTLGYFAKYSRPNIIITQPRFVSAIIPPEISSPISHFMGISIEWPNMRHFPQISRGWISKALPILRQNIILGWKYINEFYFTDIEWRISITIDPEHMATNYARMEGLGGYALYFVGLFERLVSTDIAAARKEISFWPLDNAVFGQIAIWAARNKDLITPDELVQLLKNMSDEVFWNSYFMREFLLTMKDRWREFSKYHQKHIIDRIITNFNSLDEEDKKHRAFFSLQRIQWLKLQNLPLLVDVTTIIKKFRKCAPNWKPSYAKNAEKTWEGGVRTIGRQEDSSHLDGVPDHKVIQVSRKVHEKSTRSDKDYHIHAFAGLAKDDPERAFRVLVTEGKKEDPVQEWHTFANKFHESSLNALEKRKLVCKICRWLARRIPQYRLAKIASPATSWLTGNKGEAVKILTRAYPKIWDTLFEKFVRTLGRYPYSPDITINTEYTDWGTLAINAPTGELARAMLYDKRCVAAFNGRRKIPGRWLAQAEKLLSLPDNQDLYALNIFAHSLTWFYKQNTQWTKENLLSFLDKDRKATQAAFWQGIYQPPTSELLLKIKESLFRCIISHDCIPGNRKYDLMGWIVFYWLIENAKIIISNTELHKLLLDGGENIRTAFLYQLSKHLSKKETAYRIHAFHLLKEVWPKQKYVQTPDTTDGLCNLLIKSGDAFPEGLEILYDLLPKEGLHGQREMCLVSLEKNDTAIPNYPEAVLRMLLRVLPQDRNEKYYLEKVLSKVEELHPRLKKSPDMRKLRARL